MNRHIPDDELWESGQEIPSNGEPIDPEFVREVFRQHACNGNGHADPATDDGAPDATGRARASNYKPEEPWPEPVELPGLPPVPAWNEALLPDQLRPWLSDVTERTQCPPEYAAVGAIVALASVVGRGCAIRPKRYDDWTVVPNLWGAIVGTPSTMKSPALQESTRFVRWLAAQGSAEHSERAYEREAIDAKHKAFAEQMKTAAKKGIDLSLWKTQYEELKKEAAEARRERRYIVYDATVEALGVVLGDSPRGVMLFRDELVGWFRTLDKPGHENDRSFYLTAWNGDSEYVYERISRPTVIIKNACLSIVGSIQPGPLGTYLRASAEGGVGDDGLTQRFQLLVYPDPPRDWRNVDRWPDSEARNSARAVYQRLAYGTAEWFGATVDPDNDIPYVRFDEPAQQLFEDWRHQLENRVRVSSELPMVEAHLVKYRSLLPSLALLFHLVDHGRGAVGAAAAQRAADWCELLEAHMRRVYASATMAEVNGAKLLLGRLRAGAIAAPFTVRDLHRHHWSGLDSPELAKGAIDKLAEYGWLRLVTVPTGGRPRDEAHVHPSLRRDRH